MSISLNIDVEIFTICLFHWKQIFEYMTPFISFSYHSKVYWDYTKISKFNVKYFRTKDVFKKETAVFKKLTIDFY